ncbi:MAG TPA: PAS domain S-box protein [Williamwhitmania sp.]|nr:PAS domain S-box protein [Williamwhitmania sp.]
MERTNFVEMDFSELSKEEIINQLLTIEAKLESTEQLHAEQLAKMELAQAILLEQEQNFREIFNSTRDAIFIHDGKTGAILEVNDTMLRLFGFDNKLEVLQHNTGYVSASDEGYTEEKALEMIRHALKTESKAFEWRAKKKNGTNFTVEVTLQETTIGGKNRIMATVHDLSQIQKQREALTKSEANYQNLYLMLRMMCDNVEDLLWAKDLNNCYIFANKAMCERLLGANNLSEPIGKNDMFFAERERAKHPDDHQWHTFGEICRDTDTVILKSKKTERFDEYGNVRGQFLFLDVFKSPFYDEKGNIIGTVGSGRDVTREKQLEKEFNQSKERLAKSEEKYRQLAEMATDIILMHTIDGEVTYVNPAGLKIVGLKSYPKKPQNLFDYILPEYHQQIKQGLHERVAGKLEAKITKLEILNAEGARIPLEVNASPILVNGKLEGMITICRDITERRDAEQKLRQSEEQFKSFFESNSAAMLQVDPQTGKIVRANEAAVQFYKYPEEVLLSKTVSDINVDGEQETFKRISKAQHEHNSYFQLEQKLATGEIRVVETYPTLINVGDKSYLLSIIHDITERKETETALFESEKKFRDLFENMPNGYYRSTAEGKFISVNPAFVKMLGYESSDELMEVDIPTTLNVEPTAREGIIAENKDFIEKAEIYQVKTKSGKVIWVEDNAHYIMDSSGNVQFCEGICRDITERVEYESALRNSEQRFRALVESFPDPIVLYINGKIIFINDSGLNFLRASSPDQVLGRSVLDFVHPDSHELSKERIRIVSQEHKLAPLVETKFVRLDGNIADVEVVTIPTIYDGKPALATIVHDVTTRKQNQEQIVMLTKGIEQSPVSLIITDTNGVIEYVNPHFCKVSGWSAKEAVGQKPSILKSGDKTSADYRLLWETITAGNDWQGEFYNQRKNGEGFWEFASISPIKNSKGLITHFIAVKEDITERKHTELMLKEKNEEILSQNEEYQEVNERLIQTIKELNIAKEHAEESDRLKSAFLSNMSHEIRTPMNAIMGFSKMLCEPEVGNDSRIEYAGILNNSCVRLLNTVNDVLDISKIQAGQMEIHATKFTIEKVFKELQALHIGNFNRKGISFNYEIEPRLRSTVIDTDEQKVYQILNNLLSNAFKYTEKGSVYLNCKVNDAWLELSVTDTGIGISKENQELIFDRFTQENMDFSREQEGTGLGLAISRGLAELLGGSIMISSQKGKGSTFTLWLPFKETQEKKWSSLGKDSIPTSLPESIHAYILIAEDDDFSYLLAEKILDPFPGIKILRAKTGKEAVTICRSNRSLSLIFMDIKMPEMDGLEAARRIRAFNPTIPIVALTAYALSDDREQALSAGCDDYIAKPYASKIMIQTIIKFLASS